MLCVLRMIDLPTSFDHIIITRTLLYSVVATTSSEVMPHRV